MNNYTKIILTVLALTLFSCKSVSYWHDLNADVTNSWGFTHNVSYWVEAGKAKPVCQNGKLYIGGEVFSTDCKKMRIIKYRRYRYNYYLKTQ